MTLTNETVINAKYQIIKIIGNGASSVVYLCKNLTDQKEYALKIQNTTEEFSNMDQRFKLEARTLLELNHPNIIKTYDYFEWDNRKIIVMEFVKGKTLDQVIKEKGHLSNKDSADYGLQILRALSAVHSLGVMHRDLKPANVVINLENKVKLMDFGIVQVSINQDLTKQSSIIGTIQYLAPEIFRGQKATPTSEIFSVGVLMYKMLAGVVPFYGSSPDETAKWILHKIPRKLSRLNSDIDFELEMIISKALEKEYYNRYRTTEDMIQVLEEYLKHFTTNDIKLSTKEISKKKTNLLQFSKK